jgi:hypothetical protein
MSSFDAAWLGMEDPTNLMMVTGVMALDGLVDLKRLRLDVLGAPVGPPRDRDQHHRLVPDPERIVEAFKVEFEAMRGAAAKLAAGGRKATMRRQATAR